MKITALGICPPSAARENPSVTPELLASCLARYSRSNSGIDAILKSIDWNDPDKSVDAIFRFVDYGHASIAGMTGGIAMVVDGCSMFLAYKIFEIAQLCDGQESSTRYIKMDTSNLPTPQEIGIPKNCIGEWLQLMELSFCCYQELYTTLDRAARDNPSLVRTPDGANSRVAERLRKNYALDRARYCIPFATRTNAAYIMTARVWAETIQQLDALQLPEAHACAAGLRSELQKFSPRLMSHSIADRANIEQAMQLTQYTQNIVQQRGVPTSNLHDDVFVTVDRQLPPFLPATQIVEAAFANKINRYTIVGPTIKRMVVRAAWNNMSIAELRDLNRHRSGYRFSPLTPVGFYLPEGITHPRLAELLERKGALTQKLLASDETAATYVYSLLLGTQVPFEHSTHLDKFIYEIELRTGMGAHFRYAEHLSAAYEKLLEIAPDLKGFITLGTAEPE